MVDRLSGKLGLVVRALLAGTSTDDPPAAPTVAIGAQLAVNRTSPRRFRRSAGRAWCVDTDAALVLIFSVMGYVKGTKALSRWGWIDDDGADDLEIADRAADFALSP